MDPIFNESERIERLIKASKKSPEKAILKLVEETGELVSAIEALTSYKHGDYTHVQEEAIDVLQCAMSIYFLIQNEKPFDGEAIMKAKDDKWENKYLNK
jgi:NTP pyrophosphatase (non-canonical NTP hydrolase)